MTDYDDFNNEQAIAEIEAYERDRAAGKTVEPPGPVVVNHRDSPLSAENVEVIFTECLAHGDADHPTISVEGIMHTAHFAIEKLRVRKADIGGMLAQLPLPFQPPERGGGGGWSFLNACMDRDDNQWTGLHSTMEMLFMLGLATGQAAYCLPREMWSALPGQMPYLMVTEPKD